MSFLNIFPAEVSCLYSGLKVPFVLSRLLEPEDTDLSKSTFNVA